MHDFSPSLQVLINAVDPPLDSRGTVEVVRTRKRPAWNEVEVSGDWMNEVYYCFEHAGTHVICSLRRYIKPSPRFGDLFDRDQTGWLTLAAAKGFTPALEALYTGRSDYNSVAGVRKFVRSITDGELITAFDEQAMGWGMSSWGFFADGSTTRYTSVLKGVDIQQTPVDGGFLFLRHLSAPSREP